MILSGHQPVYLPWLGLFHKISLCDTFIFMDTVQYLNQDWNNRNKIKTPNGPLWLTVPVNVKKNELMNLNEVKIAEQHLPIEKCWQHKHWKAIELNYKKCLYFNKYAHFFNDLYNKTRWETLNELNEAILLHFIKLFNLQVNFIKMSDFKFEGKKSDLILNQCIKFNAHILVTGEQGRNYIQLESFSHNNINVHFQNYQHPTYKQRFGKFLSHLSVIDLLFNYGDDTINLILKNNVTKEDLLKGNYFENN